MIRELSRVISKDVRKSAREAWKLWAPKIISLSSKTSSVKEVKELVKEIEETKDEDDSSAGNHTCRIKIQHLLLGASVSEPTFDRLAEVHLTVCPFVSLPRWNIMGMRGERNAWSSCTLLLRMLNITPLER